MGQRDSVQPLGQFPIVRTSKLDAARDAVTRVYLPHRLDSADGDQLRMTLNAAEAARFTVGFLVYGAKTRLDMPPTEVSYHVNLTTEGKTFADRTDGRRAVTVSRSSGLVLLPGRLAGAYRLPGPAADAGGGQHRRLADRDVRRARRAGGA